MSRRTIRAIIGAALLASSATPSFAADAGGASEAKALLEKAVAAVKADGPGAIAKFNRADGGFRDGDLYVFCADKDGKIDANANQSLIGTDLRNTKDKSGKMLGQEMWSTAKEGSFSEVTYLWPKPGTTDPVQKVTYVTRVMDHLCGVGYYK